MDEGGTFTTQGYRLIPTDEMTTKRHMTIRHEMHNAFFLRYSTSNLTKMLMLIQIIRRRRPC